MTNLNVFVMFVRTVLYDDDVVDVTSFSALDVVEIKVFVMFVSNKIDPISLSCPHQLAFRHVISVIFLVVVV